MNLRHEWARIKYFSLMSVHGFIEFITFGLGIFLPFLEEQIKGLNIKVLYKIMEWTEDYCEVGE